MFDGDGEFLVCQGGVPFHIRFVLGWDRRGIVGGSVWANYSACSSVLLHWVRWNCFEGHHDSQGPCHLGICDLTVFPEFVMLRTLAIIPLLFFGSKPSGAAPPSR